MAMITYETETTIDAPPSEVWRHLADFDRHDEWSQHFKLRGRPVVGEPGRLDFALFGLPARAPVVIERVDEAQELRWRGGPKGLITGSHYFILEALDDGERTHFRHGEDFSGVIAPLVWALLKAQLGPSYSGFNVDLKQRVEGA
ncbi:MAG: SRPBCC domain-containing protein [Deltaproteobacteria bacterium]|nr:SRPBCC domain-containing protein [Deltaproteobacteria bacterium]